MQARIRRTTQPPAILLIVILLHRIQAPATSPLQQLRLVILGPVAIPARRRRRRLPLQLTVPVPILHRLTIHLPAPATQPLPLHRLRQDRALARERRRVKPEVGHPALLWLRRRRLPMLPRNSESRVAPRTRRLLDLISSTLPQL